MWVVYCWSFGVFVQDICENSCIIRTDWVIVVDMLDKGYVLLETALFASPQIVKFFSPIRNKKGYFDDLIVRIH